MRENPPKELLLELFDCVFGIDPRVQKNWKQPAVPTHEDILTIERELAVQLPPLLVDLAMSSKYYSRWFAELVSPANALTNQVVELNAFLETIGKPADLIVLTQAYDDECIGILRGTGHASANCPIVLLLIEEGSDRQGSPREIAANFRVYLEELCVPPKTPVKSLRRKAKQILAAWQQEQGVVERS